jgi:hypothetical protein
MKRFIFLDPFQNEKDWKGLPKIAASAEPRPDDRIGSIQYQDKEKRKLSYGFPIETFEDDGLYILAKFISFCIFVHEISNFYRNDRT